MGVGVVDGVASVAVKSMREYGSIVDIDKAMSTEQGKRLQT